MKKNFTACFCGLHSWLEYVGIFFYIFTQDFVESGDSESIQLDDLRGHWRWRIHPVHPACNGGNTPRFVGHHSDTVVATSKCTQKQNEFRDAETKEKGFSTKCWQFDTFAPPFWFHPSNYQQCRSVVAARRAEDRYQWLVTGVQKNDSRELQDDHVVLPIIEQRHLETPLKGICLNLFVGW